MFVLISLKLQSLYLILFKIIFFCKHLPYKITIILLFFVFLIRLKYSVDLFVEKIFSGWFKISIHCYKKKTIHTYFLSFEIKSYKIKVNNKMRKEKVSSYSKYFTSFLNSKHFYFYF